MKKQLIFEHYQKVTGDTSDETQIPVDMGKLLLGRPSNVTEDDIQVE